MQLKERKIVPFQVGNLTEDQILQLVKYRVGYVYNNWLIKQLINRCISHTVYKQFVFIDKANPEYDKLRLKRRANDLIPVMLLEKEHSNMVVGSKKEYGDIVVKIVNLRVKAS